MSKIIGNIVGAAGATAYIGFLAFKIAAPPLIAIVVFCLGLMIYSFYDDMRNDREIARIRDRNNAAR